MREKVKTVYFGLQILILKGAGLQILLNPPCSTILLKYSCQLWRICNPTPLNMSICDAGKKVMIVLSDYKS